MTGAAWLALEYAEVVFYSDEIEEHEVTEYKRLHEQGAWTAWLMGAGEKKTYSEFLRAYGLGENVEPLKPEQKAAMIAKSTAIAERIMAMHRKKKNVKKNI